MTPQGFKQWVNSAAPGRRIIYYQGKHLQASFKVIALRDAVYKSYEAGNVILFQKRLTPSEGINANTQGTFAYIAVKR